MSATLDKMNELLTAEEVGARLRLRPTTISTWARRGRIPCVRLTAKVIRFRLSDVLLSLASRSGFEEVEVHP